ncbi:MAG: hypothetical protein ACR2F2_10335 [Pyrinomonadaceae bacterium]
MNATKLMIKLFLAISLFCATAFADGNMGSGGFADDGNMGSGGYTEGEMPNGTVADDGDMGAGGLTDNQILRFVRDYLYSVFG